MNLYRSVAVTFLSATLVVGCAFTTIRKVYRDPEFRSESIRHVLIVGQFENQDNRKIFENEFVQQWKTRGVDAVSSLEVFPSSAPLTKAEIAPFAKAHGFDTVLVARVIERKAIQPGEPAVASVEPDTETAYRETNATLDVLLAPPVSTSEFTLATVATNLYDVPSERRLWAGWSQTEVMKRIPKLIPPYVHLILKQLYASH